MTKILKLLILDTLLCSAVIAQSIAVNPNGVNVNSQGATTVFLTFGPIPPGYSPAEAIWCGELMPAISPALGQQCDPTTVFGSLPVRLNRSTASGTSGFTDIMGIPPSVARRAYQAAQAGSTSSFFYVRRFVSNTGGPDQYVNVTCRMAGGGARVPFALTNVEIKSPNGEPVLFVKSGEKFPAVAADIRYNGTGRLKGRWEIVQPGEEAPSDRDLLTEATLPVEQRGTQRRFTQVARFNHFLPPTGKFRLELESADKVPTLAAGQYILLLRVEATDDKESDSDLASVGAGIGIAHSGAVASFPMPTLKFFVAGGSSSTDWEENAQVLPIRDGVSDNARPVVFTWRELPDASIYKLEVLDDKQTAVLSALLVPPTAFYRAPSWFQKKHQGMTLHWRVLAIGGDGKPLAATNLRALSVARNIPPGAALSR